MWAVVGSTSMHPLQPGTALRGVVAWDQLWPVLLVAIQGD